MYKIGVDIGGTKINVGVFSGGGALLACQKLKIADIADIAEAVSGAAAELEEKLGAARDEMDFCGIGIPGTVSADGRRVVKAPNIGILHGNIAEELEERLGVRTALVQDSRAAAWGEYLFGAGKNKESVVCITLGTGIGCGIVLNGRIWNGSLGSAGELGHLPAVPNGRRCGCGKFGCVEKYDAGGGLDITAEELLGKGSTAKELFAAAEAGDESCKKALANAVMLLGNAVVAVINLLSPDCILFSGGLSEQRELYVEPLISYILGHCYSAGSYPEIKTASLGEYSPLYGAAFLPARE